MDEDRIGPSALSFIRCENLVLESEFARFDRPFPLRPPSFFILFHLTGHNFGLRSSLGIEDLNLMVTISDRIACQTTPAVISCSAAPICRAQHSLECYV